MTGREQPRRLRYAGLWTSGLALGAGLTWWFPTFGVMLGAAILMAAAVGIDWYHSTDSDGGGFTEGRFPRGDAE